ncbi:MAG TPA: hypothetical protein VH370_23130 [Humisphaera sp.]|jgi:hypothetical protein|nr:hypothetical protein [Humisphaera sp.]
MQPDYPAAHSMDTHWFAVDSAGHIGFFETGEPGPVPVDAQADEDAHEWLKHLFFAAPAMLLLNARSKDAVHAHELFEESSRRGGFGYSINSSLCMLLRSKQYVSEVGKGVQVGPDVVTPEGTVYPVYVSEIDEQAYRAIHETGTCVGCVGLWGLDENRGERLGIYHFAAEDYRHGPYVRIGVPDKPLLISQLPAQVQSLIAACPLPIRFDKEPSVQPLELVPCSTWGGGEYLASDMKTIRPMPEHK